MTRTYRTLPAARLFDFFAGPIAETELRMYARNPNASWCVHAVRGEFFGFPSETLRRWDRSGVVGLVSAERACDNVGRDAAEVWGADYWALIGKAAS